MVVIETDGNMEQVDSLKSAYDRAPTTGLPNPWVYCPDLMCIIDHMRDRGRYRFPCGEELDALSPAEHIDLDGIDHCFPAMITESDQHVPGTARCCC